MTAALVLAALLAALAVVLVAAPFLREPVAADDGLREPRADEGRLALAEERDRALAALKELEFDHRTGKLSDEDYRELVGGYRRRAATALRSLEPSPPPVPEPFPPPDEGTPPLPPPMPEPYPPPDEGTLPQPDPVPAEQRRR